MKTLHAAFSIHERSRCFGKRRNGQQHIADIHVGFEWAERNHHAVAFHFNRSSCIHRRLSIEQQLHYTADHFGERRDLLLMDNNVLASSRFFDIVNEICAQGFQKGASYIPPSAYDIAVKNLRYGYNVRGYLRKILAIYDQLEQRLKEKELIK